MSHYPSLARLPARPGRYLVRVPVTTDTNGMEVAVQAVVHVGAAPGPTLTLLSGLHGNEWLHLTAFRQLDGELGQAVAAGTMRGRVILIPVANAVALGTGTRPILDDSDNPDANRAFPGPQPAATWLADQIAAVVAHEFLAASDALIDFHLGLWGATLGSTIIGGDYSDPALTRRCEELALAFGTPLIYRAPMVRQLYGPRSSQGYAGEVLGIPCLGSMLGGAGFDGDLEGLWRERNVQGVRNVMIRLGMLEGRLEAPGRYLLYETVRRANPRTGGLLMPVRPREELGRPVEAGELLGRVVNPFTLETQEELRAPVDGYLAGWARTHLVRPGGWAYVVIPADHPGTRWVDGPQPAQIVPPPEPLGR